MYFWRLQFGRGLYALTDSIDSNALGEINVVGLKRFVASDACDVMLCVDGFWLDLALYRLTRGHGGG